MLLSSLGGMLGSATGSPPSRVGGLLGLVPCFPEVSDQAAPAPLWQLTPARGSSSLTVGPDEKVFRRPPSGVGHAAATTSGPPGALDRPPGRDRLDQPAPLSVSAPPPGLDYGGGLAPPQAPSMRHRLRPAARTLPASPASMARGTECLDRSRRVMAATGQHQAPRPSRVTAPRSCRPSPPRSRRRPHAVAVDAGEQITDPHAWPRWTGGSLPAFIGGLPLRYDIGAARHPHRDASASMGGGSTGPHAGPRRAPLRGPRSTASTGRPRRARTARPGRVRRLDRPRRSRTAASPARPAAGRGGGPAATGAPHVCGRHRLQRQISSIGVDNILGERNPMPLPSLYTPPEACRAPRKPLRHPWCRLRAPGG